MRPTPRYPAWVEIALLQFDAAWQDKPRNHEQMAAQLRAANLPVGTFVVLPEMGDTGFSLDLQALTKSPSIAWAKQLADAEGWTIQLGHAEIGPDGKGRNCATIVGPGGHQAPSYHKVFPITVLGECKSFRGGDHLVVAEIDGTPCAPLICYDLRFPELWRLAVLQGVQLFAMSAAWPLVRISHWRALLIARAIETQSFVIACNRTGADPNLVYGGSSIVIGPTGEVIAEAENSECVVRACLDFKSLLETRTAFPVLSDIRRELLGTIRTVRE